MAVDKRLVSTVGQAYDYFVGSAKAAAGGVCPSQAHVYNALAAQSSAWNPATFTNQMFLTELAAADAACKNAPDYHQKTGASVVPQGAGGVQPKVDPQTGGAAPNIDIKAAGVGAGFPWWLVLLLGGGALVWYLSTKKKGGAAAPAKKTTKRRRRTTRRRTTRRRKTTRRRTTRRRRRR
jgi:hypothetical protein